MWMVNGERARLMHGEDRSREALQGGAALRDVFAQNIMCVDPCITTGAHPLEPK